MNKRDAENEFLEKRAPNMHGTRSELALLSFRAGYDTAPQGYREALEQTQVDFHLFGCSDLQCPYADPPNQQGTNSGCACHLKTGFNETMQRIFNRTQAALDGAAPSGGWVGVGDRLPGNREKVLAYDRSGRMCEQSYEEFTDQNAEWFKQCFSHWRTLPPAPFNSGEQD